MNLKQIERYLRVNLLGLGPRLIKKEIYRAAVLQRLRNIGLDELLYLLSAVVQNFSQPYSENQLVALFIPSLFRQSTSTCFGHVCSLSSGGLLYIYSNWYVLWFSFDCLLDGRPTDSVPSHDGLQICPKHVEVD